jgi:uncharacterized coiled-coil protein SlyX
MIRSIAKALWKGIGPIRRPLICKFHSVMNEHQRSAVDELDQRVARHFHTVLERLGAIEARSQFADSVVQELDLVLNSMVRELTRVQAQVEMLDQKFEEQSTGATVVGFGTVDEADDCVPSAVGNGERPLAVGAQPHWNESQS